MRTGFIGAALALFALSGTAGAAATDVDALVSYETRQVLASGITRVDSWQERLVRRGSQVWTERVMSAASRAGHAHESAAEHIGHRHFNADTSARWLSVTPAGTVEVRFVDRERKVVVAVPRAEYGTVGFDGRFDAAASIVPPAAVQAMKPSAATSALGVWMTQRSDGWSHRVLWSPSRQLALKVESQRDDGSIRRVVNVKLLPAVAGVPAAPWEALAGYAQKRYDDFMD